MDDFPNNESTTGQIEVGLGVVSGVLNDGGTESDSDWFRISLVEGTTYRIWSFIASIGAPFFVDIEQVNNDGFIEERTSNGYFDDETGDNGQTEGLFFTASRTGDYFVSVNADSTGVEYPYDIGASVYEVPDYYWTKINLDPGVPKKQTINQFDRFKDRDSFLVELSRNGTYEFTLKGLDSAAGTLEDPVLRLYSGEDGLLLTEDGGGTGRDVSFRFVSPVTGTFQISAGSSGDSGTGTYEIEFDLVRGIDDAATGTGTASHLLLLRNQTRVLEGRLEEQGDIDWHRVDLVATRWYRFSFTSENEDSLMFIRNTDGDLINRAQGKNGEFYFRAEKSGSHHLVFRNGIDGYTITAVDNHAPKITAKHVEFRMLDDQVRSLGSIFDFEEFPATKFRIVSEAPFYLHGVEQEAHKALLFDIEDFDGIEFRGVAQRGEYDVSVRAEGDGFVSGWASTVLRSQVNGARLLDSGAKWDTSNTQNESEHVISFRFADSIPSYFDEGRFSGFSPLLDSTKNFFYSMLTQLDYTTWGPRIRDFADLRFVVDDTEDADIQIFAVDLDQHAIGYRPGKFGHGDIVLDNEIYSEAAGNTELSKEQEFQLMRAMLSAVGAKHFVGDLDRGESIMGSSAGFSNGLYPESFGYWDVEFLKSTYGRSPQPDFDYSSNELSVQSDDFYRTIHTHQPPSHRVKADNNLSAMIDLRPGNVSVNANSALNQNYVIGEGVYIYRGSGGFQDDTLIGHQNNNLLEGFAGNDTFYGLGGDDLLFGGNGDDVYVYETGDGNDTVWESTYQASGTDTVVIRGKFGFDRIEDDVTFQRLGDDLIINLATNGNYNRNEGSIIVKDMSNPANQVERLDLQNLSAQIGVYSLPAIFNAATSDQQRFASTGETDSFGLIASPV